MSADTLDALVDRILGHWLPPTLRRLLDELRGHGLSRPQILWRLGPVIMRVCRRRGFSAARGQQLLAACQAYLEGRP